MGLALNRKASRTIRKAEEIISKLRADTENAPTNDLIMADLLSVMILVQFGDMLVSDATAIIQSGLDKADKEDNRSTGVTYHKVMKVGKNLLKLLNKGITVNLNEVFDEVV